MLPKESLGTFFAIMHLDWMKCAERHTISRLAVRLAAAGIIAGQAGKRKLILQSLC